MTKFLADENIPVKVVEALKKKGIDIAPFLAVLFSPGLSDRGVLNLANRRGRVILTFDTSFGELVFKEKLRVKGVILLRFIPRSSQYIVERIESLISAGIPMEDCFLVVGEDSVRVIPLT